jgi:DNA modification methylase
MNQKQAHINTVSIPIERLIAHPKNPNTHNDRQIKKLRHLIKVHGYSKGSVVFQSSTHYLLAGHGVIEALKQEGYTHVDAVELDVDDSKAEAFMIADNKIADDSVIDNMSLQNLINELSEMNIPSLDFGFDSDDLEALASQILADSGGYQAEPQDDDIPETVEPITQAGDLWHLGSKHRLLCADSTVKENVERLLDGNKVDLFITDPPYGVSYADKNAFLIAIGKPNHIETKIEGDHQSVEDMHKLWVTSFTNAYNVCKDGACYYICSPQGGELMMMMMMMSIIEAKFELKHCLIWAKNNHVLGRSDYNYKHEPILYGWKEGGHKFYGSAGETSLWEIDKPLKSDLHPTMKPVELIMRMIKNSSLENQNVLDLFGGSGSTLIACVRMNRQCFMAEIDAHYCDVIVKRYVDFVGSSAGVFVTQNGAKVEYEGLSR